MTESLKTKLGMMARIYAGWGYTLRLTSGDRTHKQQDALFAAGKTRLRGGESLHNFGRAADLVPGSKWPRKTVDLATSFRSIAAVARACDLEAVVEPDHVHVEDPENVERG